jgi:hypothetical protein
MTDHRQLTVDLFNHTCSLLDNKNRTTEQDEEMVHAALGRFSESKYDAQLYLDACTQNEFNDWDIPFAYEGLAMSCVKNPVKEKQYLAEARQLGEKVAEEDDKQWLFTNLDEITAIIDGK